jgi:GNAT superfamily N-acetyltransferase
MQESMVQVQVVAPDSPEARWCLEEYFRELAERLESGFDSAKTQPIGLNELTSPAGAFVVVRVGPRPIGCGALKTSDRGVGEVKRMWVLADARGQGIGRRILEKLEALAREYGLSVLRLDTNRALKEAHALYRRCGYVEVAPFNDEPYAHHWFEKTLS